MDTCLSKLWVRMRDREVWCASVHRVSKSLTCLSDWTTAKNFINVESIIINKTTGTRIAQDKKKKRGPPMAERKTLKRLKMGSCILFTIASISMINFRFQIWCFRHVSFFSPSSESTFQIMWNAKSYWEGYIRQWGN